MLLDTNILYKNTVVIKSSNELFPIDCEFDLYNKEADDLFSIPICNNADDEFISTIIDKYGKGINGFYKSLLTSSVLYATENINIMPDSTFFRMYNKYYANITNAVGDVLGKKYFIFDKEIGVDRAVDIETIDFQFDRVYRKMFLYNLNKLTSLYLPKVNNCSININNCINIKNIIIGGHSNGLTITDCPHQNLNIYARNLNKLYIDTCKFGYNRSQTILSTEKGAFQFSRCEFNEGTDMKLQGHDIILENCNSAKNLVKLDIHSKFYTKLILTDKNFLHIRKLFTAYFYVMLNSRIQDAKDPVIEIDDLYISSNSMRFNDNEQIFTKNKFVTFHIKNLHLASGPLIINVEDRRYLTSNIVKIKIDNFVFSKEAKNPTSEFNTARLLLPVAAPFKVYYKGKLLKNGAQLQKEVYL